MRRELAARTVFNVLGPLTNPAGARAQVVGVYSPHLVPVIADVLAQLDARRAFVVHGAGGIDELSPAGPNLVCEVVDGSVTQREIDPLDLGIPRCDPAELRGGDATANAAGIREVFHGGQRRARARRSCSTPPARSPRAAAPTTCAKGSRSRARRSTRAPRPRVSSELVAFSQGGGA